MPCCKKSFKSEIFIDAPPALVYSQLTDFDSYKEWNAVIPDVRVKQFKEGATIRPTLISPGRGAISFRASLSKVDPEHKHFEWTAGFPIPGMFKGDHSFTVAPADDSGTKTKLMRSETYSGLMVPIFSGPIKAADNGLDAMVDALKARAEAIAKGPPAPPPETAPPAAPAAVEAAADDDDAVAATTTTHETPAA